MRFGFFGGIGWIFWIYVHLEIFWEIFLEGFFGSIFWEDIFERNSLTGIL